MSSNSMKFSARAPDEYSSRTLTVAANAAFVPIGIVTVLLGPLLPTLSTQWSLNYEKAGALFTIQFLASTVWVALSGVCISRWGFRFAIKAGLLAMTLGVAGLAYSSRAWGMVCIAIYGAGLGLAVPAANLLVAAVNPTRRGSALSLLNFSWSVGAVACPFLVAPAARHGQVPLLLIGVAGFLLAVLLGIAIVTSHAIEPSTVRESTRGKLSQIDWKNGQLLLFATLFFLYVGLENALGGWIASYAKALGIGSIELSLMTPSFFYSALMIGRWLASLLLHTIDEVTLARSGLVTACGGMACLLLFHTLSAVLIGAGVAGLGLSAIYPITISLLSRSFGEQASSVGSVVFTAANLGGAFLPWLVGFTSGRLGGLKAGMAVPLVAGAVLCFLYLGHWIPGAETPA
jgi:FHS family glucose/mannose:H+ symporter-like MFS transporter